MKPFFSIIIPTLNEEKYISKLLTDLVKQADKDFEVIIIDGKSFDKTIKACNFFKKKLSIKIIISKKKNVSYQRNYGAKYSKGYYLFFLDADSRINKNFLFKLKQFIYNNKGLVFIPYLTCGKYDKKYQALLDLSNILVESSIFINKKFSLGGSMIVERNFFNILGGFNENLFLAEDHELIQRAFFWGVNPRFLRNIKIIFSFRRWKREGEIKILYKHIIATAHRFFSGEINKKIFEYQMGGITDIKIKNKKIKKNYALIKSKKIIKELKKSLQSLIKEFNL